MHLCVLFDFFGQGLEFVVELFLFHDHFVILLCHLCELFFDPDYLLVQRGELAFIVLQAHLMLFELPKQGFESVFFQTGFVEWLLHWIIFLLQLRYFGLVFLGFLINFFDVSLMVLDQLQVVPCYFIVVAPKIFEGSFVIFDKLVDMQVLPFLEFVNVNF